jgi:hypothetical protein
MQIDDNTGVAKPVIPGALKNSVVDCPNGLYIFAPYYRIKVLMISEPISVKLSFASLTSFALGCFSSFSLSTLCQRTAQIMKNYPFLAPSTCPLPNIQRSNPPQKITPSLPVYLTVDPVSILPNDDGTFTVQLFFDVTFHNFGACTLKCPY